MTTTEKARNVADSITTHGLDVEDVETWKRYGLESNPAQQELVRQALGK